MERLQGHNHASFLLYLVKEILVFFAFKLSNDIMITWKNDLGHRDFLASFCYFEIVEN